MKKLLNLSPPSRGEFSVPGSLTVRATDEAQWRAFCNCLKARAIINGWKVSVSVDRHSPSMWVDFRVRLTKDGSTPIEMFSTSFSEVPLIVRQFGPQFSGPNHSIPGPASAALELARELAALPFDRDSCPHCPAGAR